MAKLKERLSDFEAAKRKADEEAAAEAERERDAAEAKREEIERKAKTAAITETDEAPDEEELEEARAEQEAAAEKAASAKAASAGTKSAARTRTTRHPKVAPEKGSYKKVIYWFATHRPEEIKAAVDELVKRNARAAHDAGNPIDGVVWEERTTSI